MRINQLAAVIVCTAVAVSCAGSSGEDTDGQATPNPVDTQTVAQQVAESAPISTDDAAADAAPAESEPTSTDSADVVNENDEPTDADGDEAGGTRIVVDALGEVEVPAAPQRIVVLDPGAVLPTFLELGAPVVAANVPSDDFETAVVPLGQLDGIESVGFPEPSLELIAAQDPDVIVYYHFDDDERYDELAQIAPTVAVERDLNDWRASTRRAADAIGMANDFDALLAAHDARIAALVEGLGERLDDEISVVRAIGNGVRMHTRFHFAGQVLESIGFRRPAEQRSDDPAERFIQISLEELDRIDGDTLFVFGRGLDDDAIQATLDEVQSNPLFATLDVARDDRVFVVDTLAWQQGGVRAADIIIDDIAAAYDLAVP